jgi:hypothetical protein
LHGAVLAVGGADEVMVVNFLNLENFFISYITNMKKNSIWYIQTGE